MALVMPSVQGGPSFAAMAFPDEVDLFAESADGYGTGVLGVPIGGSYGAVGGGLVVTQHTGSDMAVDIAAGWFAINNVLYYYGGATNVAIAAASSGDRRDTVVMRITPGSYIPSYYVVKGTPCGYTAGNWTPGCGYEPPMKGPMNWSLSGTTSTSVNLLTDVVLGEVYVSNSTTAIVGTTSTIILPTTGNIVDKTIPTQVEMGSGVYGDGSSGSGVMDGSATVAGMAPLSSTLYEATGDLYFFDLVINSGITLDLLGFRLFVQNLLIVNGVILDVSLITFIGGNTASPLGTVGVSGAGGTGTTTGGAAGGSINFALGGAGGAGGAGTDTAGAGGTGAFGVNASVQYPRALPMAVTGVSWSAGVLSNNLFNGGGGGGAGGGGGSAGQTAGNGGAGGGVVIVAARIIQGTGTIQANGFPGTNAASAGNTGCGGGGGGGMVVIISQTPDPPSVTIEALGGAGGATPHGTGHAGSAGSAGTVILLQG
jgi:hypothetical protein